ncbi:MAG: ABC transporter substrate-binding protein [Nitrosopumilus sp.]|nr:ABC transporter substrate-binding protein [Nitrosopumilus sp.]MDH3340759.1 ABC transporter substrate-binding protein [Nitrosopumilus sp.]
MKSTQLLSVVLSLIMVFGVPVGSTFAEMDNDDSNKEDFDDDRNENNDDERDNDETRDDDDDRDKHDDLEDRLEDFCKMTADEKDALFADHPRVAQFEDRLTDYCELSDDERDDAIEDFIEEYFPETRDYDLDDMLDRYCEMTDEQKQDFLSMHDKPDDHIAKVNAYCELDEDERDAYIEQHEDEFRKQHGKDMQGKLERYCEMSDSGKREFLSEHDKTADHAEKMNTYCELDKDGRINFIEEHRDEYMSHMKDKMSDYKTKHMMLVDEMKDKQKQARDHNDYSKYCKMSEGQRVMEIDDPEKLERISNWCEMSSEERKNFNKEHHDAAMDFKEEHLNAVETIKEKRELSPRLKEMIMDKYDITDERMDEIKMKYKDKHGDLTDKKKSELKIKFKDHLSSIKVKMSDEHKSAIHDRVAEMKAFKAELREKASDLTDDEKQQLREEFIQKAKDMQLAWISPRTQITAGIDAAEVECREGFSLVMKASNGVPMCLKADTALKMIDRGLVVPSN